MVELRVDIDAHPVGTLIHEDYLFSFRYDEPASLDRSRHLVSLTMPVRGRSYDTQMLPPPFQSVLPEGELLSQLRARFGKVLSLDDDFELLRLVGSNTIGRLTFVDPDETSVSANEPFNLDTMLRHPDANELFAELVERYGLRFGVGGVQPKGLIPTRARASLPTVDFIFKLSGSDFPYLAVNEHFCMQASHAADIPTAEHFLADNLEMLAVRRFDRDENGAHAFEEMCALLRLSRHGKYSSSCEAIAEVVRQIPCTDLVATLEDLFARVAFAMISRNGDAHLKNFGVVYDTSDVVHLAPAYDLVTTTVYIARDQPALELGGRKTWPTREALERFGLGACNLRRRDVRHTLDRVMAAVSDTMAQVDAFRRDHPACNELCTRMIEVWREGLDSMK